MRAADSERERLLRFLLVGSGFSGFYAITTALLINFAGAPPFWTSVLVYGLCIPAAFWMQKRFTFSAKALRPGAMAYYAGTQILGIALVSLVTTRFVTYNWWLDTALMGMTVALSAGLNFVVGRSFTFRSQA